MSDPLDLTIREAGQLLRGRQISAKELVADTYRRIEATEPAVSAFAATFQVSARRAASRADSELARGHLRGPLHGIPVGIKDMLHTRDAPATGGSRVHMGLGKEREATVVRRLRDAGAIIVGSTVTHEFALGQNEVRTKNPWNASQYPGGSSAGSAVGVAVRSMFASIGTDTGGSIRSPASINGIVGLKPTYGRVSRFGLILASPSLDHIGPLARTVEDCALMLEVTAGGDPADPSCGDWDVPEYSRGINDGIAGVRLGVDREYFFSDHVDGQVDKAVSEALFVLKSLGAKLVDVRIPELDLSRSICLTLMLVEAGAIHARLLSTTARRDYDPMTQLALETGMLIPGSLYLAAQRARRMVRDGVKRAFRQLRLSALIGPTLPVASTRLSDLSVDLAADSADTASFAGIAHHLNPANVTGQPSITLPCGFTTEEFPIGLQVLGRPLDEACVFRIGHAYEQATEWNTRRPTFISNREDWAAKDSLASLDTP